MSLFFRRKKISLSKKTPKDGFFKRFFAPKDLFIKKEEQMTFVALTTLRQSSLFGLILFFVLWSLFTSFYFFYHHPLLSSTREDLKQTEQEKSFLKKEMQAFELFISDLLIEIEDSKAEALALKEKSKKKEKLKSLEKKHQELEEKTAFLEERLSTLKNPTTLIEKANKEQNLNQVLLQRDLAVVQSLSLQEKVKELEALIEKMQETQILVFRKMEALSEKNILAIEEDMSEIKTALSKTGLSMAFLLNRIHRTNLNAGIGEPYIPQPIPNKKNQLNISLVSLKKQMNAWYDLTSLQKSLPLGKPIKRIRVTSPFGSREDPFRGVPAIHEGVDLAGMLGEPIQTKAAGKVIRATQWGWYGNIVEIDHGSKIRTRYAHMDRMFVSKGDTVKAGDIIGTLGSTGRSTGPHVHYEIRVNGHAVNPLNFIKAGKNVFKN